MFPLEYSRLQSRIGKQAEHWNAEGVPNYSSWPAIGGIPLGQKSFPQSVRRSMAYAYRTRGNVTVFLSVTTGRHLGSILRPMRSLVLLPFLGLCGAISTLPAATDLRIDGLDPSIYSDPWKVGLMLAVDTPNPVFSWSIPPPPTGQRGVQVAAVRVIVQVEDVISHDV
eukprot:1366930-Amorphochlora_amoeboformis.AAC.2